MDMNLSQNRRFITYLFFSIIWTFIIIYLLIFFKPSNIKNIDVMFIDKIIHFSLFFIESYLVTKCYILSKKNSKKSLIIILIPLVIFSIMIEVIQVYLPFRSYDLFDLSANILGFFIGSFIAIFFGN